MAGKTIENRFNKNHIWGAPYVLPVYGEKVLVTQRENTIINDERRKNKKVAAESYRNEVNRRKHYHG